MASVVRVERPEEHVAVVRLDRPERLNAMSIELCLRLEEAFDALGRDDAVRAVVLTGTGRAFCAGLDLRDHGSVPGGEGLPPHRLGPRAMGIYSRLTPALREVPQPVVAAVNGAAYGGGMCLALGADLRIAGASAEFNATGLVNGLASTELGASWLLPRLVGAAHAADLLLTGRRVGADEALRMGLVSRVVPDAELEAEALAMARGMARFSPLGLRTSKRVLQAGLESPSLAAAIALEDHSQLLLGMTDNLPEAIEAFFQKRAPVFTDRPRRDLHGADD